MRSGTSAVPCHPDNGSQRQARAGRPSPVGPDRPDASRAGPSLLRVSHTIPNGSREPVHWQAVYYRGAVSNSLLDWSASSANHLEPGVGRHSGKFVSPQGLPEALG